MYHLIEHHLPPKLPSWNPPMIHLPPTPLSSSDKLAKVLHKDCQAHIQRVFIEAIQRENDGVMPPNEELYKWAKCYLMPDGTYMLTWGAPPYAVGEKVETKYIIAQVAPPL